MTKKDSQLDVAATLALTDRLRALIDPAGTPTSETVAVTTLLNAIDLLTADGSPDTAADYLLSFDDDAGTVKKVLMSLVTPEYVRKASVSQLVQSGTISTGDGKIYILMPAKVNGMNLVGAAVSVITKSTSGTPTVQLARGRQANATSAHTFNDMLTTRITIDADDYSSADATTPAVIDGTYDDMATGDLIRVDIDVTGTGTATLYIYLEFALP